MSGDGPSKLAPQGAETLDEIILGDEPMDVAPPAQQPASLLPPRPRLPTQPPLSALPRAAGPGASPEEAADTREPPGRRRAKLTLRIPDDEVARPTLSGTTPASGAVTVRSPSPGRPPSEPDLDVVTRNLTGPPPPVASFGPDDTVELSPEEIRARLAVLTGEAPFRAAPALGIDATSDPGWTPYQPEVVAPAPESVPIQPQPIIELRAREPALLDAREVSGASEVSDAFGEQALPVAPVSEEIPVDMDLSDVPDPSSDELATSPRLPLDPDDVDEGERASDGFELEVAPEDLVSVESLPAQPVPPPVAPTGSPASLPPRPIQTTGKSPAFKAPEAALAQPPPPSVSGSPAGGGLPRAPSTPSIPPPPPASALAPPPSVGPEPASTRPPAASPLVFGPPASALAPPPMTETMGNRKKTRPWWEELFNDDFIRTMAKVTDEQIDKEISFIEESLGCEAGAMILDLACGTGRHAVELAARGYQVVGFDLSLAMLARASEEAQDRKQKLNFVQGDMREMTFEETFDGVFSWNTSFGFFDEEKNGAVIARVHKALKKGGQFLLDVVNRDYIVRQAPSLAWFEGDGCICMDEMTIDFITSRMKVKRTLMMDDGRTKEIEYSVRVYSLHELGKMLHDNGFRVAEVSGRTGTPGVFFGCESPRTLILAEKR